MQDTQTQLHMGITMPLLLETSKSAHLNFTYIPITLYQAPLQRHFKALIAQPNGDTPKRQ